MTCYIQYERLNRKDHKTRTGIEPASSDNRLTALPIKRPDHCFSSYKSNYTSNILFKIYKYVQDSSDPIDFLELLLYEYFESHTNPT